MMESENANGNWWDELAHLAADLYPRGPEDAHIWKRAGGDLSTLDLTTPARASWFSALSRLRQGGGGNSITPLSLLGTMKLDFPNNELLTELANREEGSTAKSTVSVCSEAFDDLDYRTEDQEWYAASLPDTELISFDGIDIQTHPIGVVLLTATDTELKAVMRLLKPPSSHSRILQVFEGSETYYIGEFGRSSAVVTKCRKGAVAEGASTLATAQALRVWKPKAIIMVGIAFGLSLNKQRMGDVLVASEVIPYEQQRVGSNIVFRGPIPPSDRTLLNRFENAQNWSFIRPDGLAAQIHVGPVLSGEKLIDNADYKRDQLEQHPQAIGGEMEGAGVYAAATAHKTPWILAKAICDWADGKKDKKHQPLAAAAAASLVEYVLSKEGTLGAFEK